MVVRVAQVKCYSCGRVCGEVKGEDLYGLRLQDMYVPKYAGPSGAAAAEVWYTLTSLSGPTQRRWRLWMTWRQRRYSVLVKDGVHTFVLKPGWN